ncbi:MAG: GNAT family N-acetyltransferase [Tateyamaria sp.]|uniref:GNAT family N-acetyltransferase n=1 Tax=Tateyamaria sp. TaxID=1929288 RepID=UPI0032A0B708
MIEIGKMRRGEADALGHVMWDAIHNTAGGYTVAERHAWCAAPNGGPAWAARLAAQTIWVARRGDAPCAFVTLADQGYVEFTYVQSNAQGLGLFRRLMDALEVEACANGARHLWTHASLMAQPAFAAIGFHVIHHETVARGDQMLKRAQMKKVLP